MAYLNEWALLEGNHVDALAGISEDFKAGTLRLPLTGGALVMLVCKDVFWFDTWEPRKQHWLNYCVCPFTGRY